MPDKQPVTPYVFGAAVLGPRHQQTDTPLQDSFAFAIAHPGWVAIAVADGLGSAIRSELGASTAAHAAVQGILWLLSSDSPKVPSLKTLVVHGVRTARLAVEMRALYENRSIDDLASTLIAVVAKGDSVCAAHVGDGAAVAKKNRALSVLSAPEPSEYVDEVVPITASDWLDHLRISRVVDDVEALVVFTDGCQRAALQKIDGAIPYAGFLDPLFGYAATVTNLTDAKIGLRTLLDGPKMRDHSEDDKTLVIAVLGG